MEDKEPLQGENPLGTASVGSLLRKFAVPSIIAMLVGSIYNIVDQFFIGQTVGVLGNSATNVAFPLNTCCVALALLFGIGGAAAFNLSMGRKEYDKAPWYICNSAMALFVSGVLLCLVTRIFLTPLLRAFGAPDNVLPYAQTYAGICAFGYPFLILTTGGGHLIRADGSPGMVMICSLSGAIINVVLDAIFVMGFHWGMAGAATATIIGQIFSGCQVIWYMVRRYHTVKLSWRYLRPRPDCLGRAASIGTASCFNQMAILLLQIVLNNSLRFYGGQSVYGEDIPLAVAGIVVKISSICMSVLVGIGQACQPILSFNYGAGKYDRVRRTYWMAATVGGIVSVCCWLMYMFLPRQLLGLFGEGSEAYFQCGILFFRVYLFMTFANFLQPITSTLFSALGKPKKGIFLSLTRQVIFLIPMMLIFPMIWGFEGIVCAAPIADTLALLASIILAHREFVDMHRLEKLARETGGERAPDAPENDTPDPEAD